VEGSSSQEIASWTRCSINIISINMRRIRLSMSSLTSRRVRLRRSRGWSLRLDRRAFLGGLMSCRFYRTSVNTWHAGYGSIRCKYNCNKRYTMNHLVHSLHYLFVATNGIQHWCMFLGNKICVRILRLRKDHMQGALLAGTALRLA
jgi:hypothetical protein